jgi:two-component system, cell cycle sensor histidine kinase and response regulator CckA
MSLPVRILLIEDNPGDAQLLEEYLPRNLPFDLDITHCDRLAKALSALRRSRFDLILSDLFLPDSMGFSTFTQVHELAGDAPIVVLTAWEDQEQVTKALENGARDFINKSNLDGVQLVRILRQTLRLRAVPTSSAIREDVD